MSGAIVSGIPALIDQLVVKLDGAAGLEDVVVSDGVDVSSEDVDMLQIGVDDPELLDVTSSAESGQATLPGTQHKRDETGRVTCLAIATEGGPALTATKAARDRVFAMAAAVGALVQADPSLELGYDSDFPYFTVRYGTQHRLIQNRLDAGSVAILIFQLEFETRV